MDVIGLKTDIINLVDRTIKLLEEIKKEKSFVKSCEEEIENLKKRKSDLSSMNAKMLIMAPMKAGKSTLINAICGKKILPARNTAMTTIPTEIKFQKEKKEPELNLTVQLLDFFNEALNSIQPSLGVVNFEEHSHLIPLIEEFKSCSDINLLLKEKDIESKLSILNDLLRIRSLIDKKIYLLPEIPCVTASFYGKDPIYSGNNDISDSIGTLTIIDAPGKNENAISDQLEQFVSELSNQIHMVLLVFDYTQLKSISSEDVKDEVKQISESIGQDKIYIVVNKIDQRGNENDSSAKDTSQSIKAGMSFIVDDKIFEVSAKYAFVSNTFFSIRNSLNKEIFREQEACKELAGVIWPTSPEDFEEIEFEKFIKRGEKVFEKSKITAFLEKALRNIIKLIAPNLIKLAIKSLEKINSDLKVNFQNILSVLKVEIDSISKAINQIERDKNEVIEILENRRKEIESTLNTFDYEFNNSIENLNEEIEATIKSQITKVFDDWANNSLYKSIDISERDYKVRYNAKSKAENALKELNSKIKKEIKNKVETEKVNIEKRILSNCKKNFDGINNEILGIKEKIEKYLKSIKVQSFPNIPSLQVSSLDINSFTYEEKEHTTIKQDTERRWYTLWLYPHDIEVEEKQITFIVDLKSAEKHYIDAFKQYLKHLKEEIKTHIERNLNEKLENHLHEVEKIMNNYISSLQEALNNHNLSKEDQEKKKFGYEQYVKKISDLNAELMKQKNILQS